MERELEPVLQHDKQQHGYKFVNYPMKPARPPPPKKPASPVFRRPFRASSSPVQERRLIQPGFDLDTFCTDFSLALETKEILEQEQLTEAHLLAELTEEDLVQLELPIAQRKMLMLGIISLKNDSLDCAVARRENEYSIKRRITIKRKPPGNSALAGAGALTALGVPRPGARNSSARRSMAGARSSGTRTKTSQTSARNSMAGAQAQVHTTGASISSRLSTGAMEEQSRTIWHEDSLDWFRTKQQKCKLLSPFYNFCFINGQYSNSIKQFQTTNK